MHAPAARGAHQQHAPFPDGDHGSDGDAGLLLRVYRHVHREGENYFNGRLSLYKPTGAVNCMISWNLYIWTFATDTFVNAGQVVTGNLAPHFLALCKPNCTALGCQQHTQFISGEEACTGNPDLIMRARKTSPSKAVALSVYAALYLTIYITHTIKAKGTRFAKPILCLGLMCLAFLTGLNRVAEYRNYWSDVIAGFLVGIPIAVFLVVCVVNNFKGRQPENEHIHMDDLAQMPMISIPQVESPLEKNHITTFAEVT
ncbi:hypothetical protein MC885_005309 [Smutsia gigantea]|nr:hypothetical protein MC885_005309 [Smutsia gigantea]